MRERKVRLASLGLPSTHWASLVMPHELSDLDRPKAVPAKSSEDYHQIHFPLRSEVRSRVLLPSAKLKELWQHLKTPDWFAGLPVDEAALLESGVRDEYIAHL